MDNSQAAPQEDKQPGQINKKAFGLIFLTVFIDLVGFGLIIPAIPTFAQSLAVPSFLSSTFLASPSGHASESAVGLLIASYSLMQFIFMPFWGRLSDRVGRRPVLLLSLLASSVGYLIWGFSQDLVVLLVSRLVAGFGNANIAVAQAYIADITTPETRAKGMGLVGAAFGLGFVLGPAIGFGCMSLGMSIAAIGFVAAAFSALDLALTAVLLPEPKKRSSAGAERYGMGAGFFFKTIVNPKMRISLALFLISTFAFANMEATLVLLTVDQFQFDSSQNMIMFVYIGVLMVIVQGRLIHGLSKRFGEKKLILAGSLLIAIGLLLTPLTSQVVVLYVALALLAVGSGINTPANQSMLSKLAPPDCMGGVMGVGQSLSTLGRILGPAIGCAVYQYLGHYSPYLLGAVTMIGAAAASTLLPNLSPSDGSPVASKPAGQLAAEREGEEARS